MKWTALFVLTGFAVLTVHAETVADRLMADYTQVQSVTCEIRKDTETPGGKGRMLSRVYYQRPDRLNVENISPLERRIVSDGTNFYSYITGDAKGFSRPVAKLSEEMLISLRKVPGTAEDHLMRLRGASETNLGATAEFPVRVGYNAGKVFAVLSLDATGRLARVELYTASDMSTRSATYNYSEFKEVLPKVWIPCLHQAVAELGGVQTKETVRVNNLSVNQPIPTHLFVAAPFFDQVQFEDSFDKMYP